VANFIDKVGGGIYARSEIKRPEDLRGKTVGVGRAGSISDSIARYVLRATLGLAPDRDVKLLVVSEPGSRHTGFGARHRRCGAALHAAPFGC
jgi:ABC-type nitrate/sulfonate/bicarbonate transport system substrate-binding protein